MTDSDRELYAVFCRSDPDGDWTRYTRWFDYESDVIDFAKDYASAYPDVEWSVRLSTTDDSGYYISAKDGK